MPERKISKLAVLKAIKSMKGKEKLAKLRQGLIKYARRRGWL